jgi:hypothetical protein
MIPTLAWIHSCIARKPTVYLLESHRLQSYAKPLGRLHTHRQNRSRYGKLACRAGTRQAGPADQFQCNCIGICTLVWTSRCWMTVLNTWVCMKLTWLCFLYKHLSCAAFKIKLTSGSGNAITCEKLHDQDQIRLRQKASVCASTLTVLSTYCLKMTLSLHSTIISNVMCSSGLKYLVYESMSQLYFPCVFSGTFLFSLKCRNLSKWKNLPYHGA